MSMQNNPLAVQNNPLVAAAAARVNMQNNPLAVQIAVTQVRQG